jgi:hypothetical protein
MLSFCVSVYIICSAKWKMDIMENVFGKIHFKLKTIYFPVSIYFHISFHHLSENILSFLKRNFYPVQSGWV